MDRITTPFEVIEPETDLPRAVKVVNPTTKFPFITRVKPVSRHETLLVNYQRYLAIPRVSPGQALAQLRQAKSGVAKVIAGGGLIALGIVAEGTPFEFLSPFLLGTGGGLLLGGITDIFFPLKIPGQNDESKTYIFGLLGNSQGQGILLPPVYGTHRIAGTVISVVSRPHARKKWRRRVSVKGLGAVTHVDGITRFVVEILENTTGFSVAYLAVYDKAVLGNYGCWYKATSSPSWIFLGFADIQKDLQGNFSKWELPLDTYQIGLDIRYHYKYTVLPNLTFSWVSVIAESIETENDSKMEAQITFEGPGVISPKGVLINKSSLSSAFVPGVGIVSSWRFLNIDSDYLDGTKFKFKEKFKLPTDAEEIVMLIAVAEGEVSFLSSFEVNGQPLHSFRNVWIDYRYGKDQQTVIPETEETRFIQPVAQGLLAGIPVIKTSIGRLDSIRLTILFPQGLHRFQKDGDLKTEQVGFKIEWKKTADVIWNTLTEFGPNPNSPKEAPSFKDILHGNVDGTFFTPQGTVTNGVFNIKRAVLSPFKVHIVIPQKILGTPQEFYAVRITRMTQDHVGTVRHTSDSDWLEFVENTNLIFEYPNTALVSLVGLASEELQNGQPTVTCITKGTLCKVPLLTKTGVTVEYSDCYWDPVGSTYKLFKDDSTVVDTGLTVRQWTSNPIWHVYDIMVNCRYGAGGFLDVSQDISFDQFKTEAQFCDELVAVNADSSIRERRYEQDRVLDSQRSLWDNVLEFLNTCQGVPITSGSVYQVKIDRPTLRTDIISPANTANDVDVVLNYSGLKQAFNALKVQFADREKDWQLTVLPIENQQLFSNTEKEFRPKSLNLIGVSKRSQVERRMNRELNFFRLIKKTMSVTTGWDYLTTDVFSRVGVQTSYTKWLAAEPGQSTRVAQYMAPRTIRLTTPITFTGLHTYKLIIRYQDKTLQTLTLMPINTETDEITIISTESFAQPPQQDDVLVLGEDIVSLQDFRIMSISKTADGRCQILLLEYNDSLLQDIIPLAQTTALIGLQGNPNVLPAVVTNVRAIAADDEGVDILISWIPPSDAKFASVDIYVSVNNKPPQFLINTPDTSFLDRNRKIGSFYLYTVQSVSRDGAKSNFAASPQASLVLGGALVPADVTGLRIFKNFNRATQADPHNTVFEGRDVRFEWKSNSTVSGAGNEPLGAASSEGAALGEDPLFFEYLVKIKNLDGTLRRRACTKDAAFIYTFQDNLDDSFTTLNLAFPTRAFIIEVFSRNRVGVLSENPAILSVSNPVPLPPTNIQVVPSDTGILISWDPSIEFDVELYKVYASASASFIPSAANLVFTGAATQLKIPGTPGQTIYVKISSQDSFGADNPIFSPAVSSTVPGIDAAQLTGTINVLQQNIGLLQQTGGTFSDNTPTAGFIAWTGLKLFLNGVEYVIADDNTLLKWVYWTEGDLVLTTSESFPALVATSHMVVLNSSGKLRMLIGNRLQPGMIEASHLTSGLLSDNLILNGCFEDNLSGWAPLYMPSPGQRLLDPTAPVGSYVLDVIVDGGASAGPFGSRAIAVNDQSEYVFSVWANSATTVPGNFYMYVYEMPTQPPGGFVLNSLLTSAPFYFGGVTPLGWTFKEVTYTPTPGARYASFFAWVIPTTTGTGTGQHIQLTGFSVKKRIGAGDIKSNAVQIQHIKPNAVTGPAIAPNAITTNKIMANQITSEKIGANEIKAINIGANEIKAGKIDTDAITSVNIQAGQINAGLLSTDFQLTKATQIGTAVIDTAHITNLAVTTIKIEPNAVSTSMRKFTLGTSTPLPTGFWTGFEFMGITSGGGTVLYRASFDVNVPTPLASGQVFLQLTQQRIPGNPFALWFGAPTLSSGKNTQIVFDISVTSAGSYTYALEAWIVSTTVPVSIDNISQYYLQTLR